ncbi:MAG: hypothetical protein HKN32_06575, partial [Flavobacteriales bacterium]|nr:hypothetical protein [Flavobacteriales bacterium]
MKYLDTVCTGTNSVFSNVQNPLSTASLTRVARAVITTSFLVVLALMGSAQTITLDQWDANTNCSICGDSFTSTINSAYTVDSDAIDFTDPIGDASQCITAITLTFNVAAADYNLSQSWSDVQQIAQAYPIELNGYEIGTFDPEELPYICNVCEANPTVTFAVDPDLLPYNFGATNTFDFNFFEFGDANGTLQDVCVANVVAEFHTSPCSTDCGEITGVYVYDQLTDAPVVGLGAISNGQQINQALLPDNYYIAVEVSGTIESVSISLDGISQNVENYLPYTWPNGADGGSSWNGGVGEYLVWASAYSMDHAAGTLCDMIDVSFSIVDDEVSSCDLDGWEYEGGRVFWLPGYGTDFIADPLIGLQFDQFPNGTAHLHGRVIRSSNANDQFDVDIWFNNKSTYSEWIAQGNAAKDPQLGDETTWTYYDWDASYDNRLIGAGNLAGVELHLEDNLSDGYGLQIGDGANALSTAADGFSTWFDYTGSSTGSGDINGTLICEPLLCALDITTMTESATCGQCDGAVWVNVYNGSGGYTYLLNGAAIADYNIPYDGQIDIYSLCPGDYTVTATDSDGCSADKTFTIAGAGDCIQPPTSPTCNLESILWENTIDVTNLSGSAGIPQVDLRFVDGNITQYEIPVALPAAFSGPVTVSVDEAISWDAYLTRPNTGDQPNEQWKVVFLKNGSIEYETGYTGDLATGVQADEWIGALGVPT